MTREAERMEEIHQKEMNSLGTAEEALRLVKELTKRVETLERLNRRQELSDQRNINVTVQNGDATIDGNKINTDSKTSLIG